MLYSPRVSLVTAARTKKHNHGDESLVQVVASVLQTAKQRIQKRQKVWTPPVR
jgi:hypothetical protein